MKKTKLSVGFLVILIFSVTLIGLANSEEIILQQTQTGSMFSISAAHPSSTAEPSAQYQTFTITNGNSYNLSTVSLNLWKLFGSPTNNVTVNIYATTGANPVPTGSPLATSSPQNTSSFSGPAWYNFTIPTTISNGTTYALALQDAGQGGTVDTSNKISWQEKNADVVSGGLGSFSFSNWGYVNSQDFAYILYGVNADADSPTFSAVTSNSTMKGSPFQLSANLTDATGVSHYWFSTNNTGPWINQTAQPFTSNPATYAGTLNSTAGVVSVKVYSNDTLGNEGVSVQYDFALTDIYLTLQARDRDGENVPRVFAFTGSLANASSLNVTSGSTGTYSLATSYGAHTFNVWWGSHLVLSNSSYSATANATVNLDTKTEYFTDGNNVILWSINGSDPPSAVKVSSENCKLSPVSYSEGAELKVDVAGWLQGREPSILNVGGLLYEKPNWVWDSTNKVLTYTLGAAATDTFVILEYDSLGNSDGSTTSTTPPPSDSDNNSPGDSGAHTNPTPEPFVLPQVSQGLIVAVAAMLVVGLLSYVYYAGKARGKTKPSWDLKITAFKKKSRFVEVT